MVTLFTWDDIYVNALETGFGDWQLTAKDNARAELTEMIKESSGVDVDETECPEDTIDDWIAEQDKMPYFDIHGYYITSIQKSNSSALDKTVEANTNELADMFPDDDIKIICDNLGLPYDKS